MLQPTARLGRPLFYAKRVRVMFGSAVDEGHHIKPQIAADYSLRRNVHLCGFRKVFDFPLVNSLRRMPELGRLGTLDFNEHDQIPFPDDQVNLFVSGSPVSFDNFVPLCEEEPLRHFLVLMAARYSTRAASGIAFRGGHIRGSIAPPA